MATPTARTRGRRSATRSETDDWDLVERWTRRIGRWALIGVPSWLLLLAAFNERLTGIPWIAGLTMASVLALTITAVADRMAAGPRGRRMGPFGRAVIVWSASFAVLAIVMSTATNAGAALFVVPFLGATAVAAVAEGARRALRGRP